MSLEDREWPASALPKMAPSIITTSKEFRTVSGVRLIPSPDPEAHVRYEDSNSRHAVGVSGFVRLSDGTDLFLVDNRDAARAWIAAQRVPSIGGLGIYFDTEYNGEKRVLLHLDNRAERLLWVCPSRNRATQSREYIYLRDRNPGPFLDILSAEFSRL